MIQFNVSSLLSFSVIRIRSKTLRLLSLEKELSTKERLYKMFCLKSKQDSMVFSLIGNVLRGVINVKF